MYDFVLGSIITFFYLVFGFGVKHLLYKADYSLYKFPLIIIIWPIILLMYGFSHIKKE